MTRTYAVMEVTPFVYSEIAGKLMAAGYTHAFGENGEMDMQGIALHADMPVEADDSKNLICTSLYGRRMKKGRVQITCPQKDFTIQLDVAEAMAFAVNILQAATAAQGDEVFAKWAQERLGFDELAVAQALAGFREMRGSE